MGNTKTPRTRFAATGPGRVTMTYFNIYSQEVETREFYCSQNGGYVFEATPRIGGKQVCDTLANRGVTLLCESGSKLLDVIRHEYYAMRKEEKRHGCFGQ